MLNNLALVIHHTNLDPMECNSIHLSLSEQTAVEALQPLLSLSNNDLASHLSGEPEPVDWTVVSTEMNVEG